MKYNSQPSVDLVALYFFCFALSTQNTSRSNTKLSLNLKHIITIFHREGHKPHRNNIWL